PPSRSPRSASTSAASADPPHTSTEEGKVGGSPGPASSPRPREPARWVRRLAGATWQALHPPLPRRSAADTGPWPAGPRTLGCGGGPGAPENRRATRPAPAPTAEDTPVKPSCLCLFLACLILPGSAPAQSAPALATASGLVEKADKD